MTSKPVEGKIALITGANKGIGLEIARQLGTQGITVLIGVRDENRGREAAEKLHSEQIDAHVVQLDVTNQDSIDAAASHIESEFGKLDILVNNAGIAVENVPPSELDIEVLRHTYDTNFFGVFAVTKAMLPLLRKSDAGRIVNMSSGLGSLAQNTDPNYEYGEFKLLGYNSSKTALNAMTIQFAHELKDTPIKVNSADRGYVATDINSHGGSRTVQQGAVAPLRLATLPADGPTGGFFDENGIVPW